MCLLINIYIYVYSIADAIGLDVLISRDFIGASLELLFQDCKLRNMFCAHFTSL